MVIVTQEAENVVEALGIWYQEHAAPEAMLSDNGGEFIAHAFQRLHEIWASEIRHGSPYKPSTQGAIEARNRYVKTRIRKDIKERGISETELTLDQLNEIFAFVINAINHEEHSVTKAIPFELFHGRTDYSYYCPMGLGMHSVMLIFLQHPLQSHGI